MKILIVDDEPVVAKAICDLLRDNRSCDDSEYEVSSCGSCTDAIHLVQRDAIGSQVDCVILDWVLPDATGDRCIPRLRDIAPFTGVVVVTGHDDTESFLKALRSGGDGFVGKLELYKKLLPVVTDAVQYRRRRYASFKDKQSRVNSLNKLQTSLQHEIQEIKETIRDEKGG
jgi:DNA-binding response OmpR family regulator